MKEVLVGEENELSLTSSNFFINKLEDTANKMLIAFADGWETLVRNTGAELLASPQLLRLSHLQQKEPTCM